VISVSEVDVSMSDVDVVVAVLAAASGPIETPANNAVSTPQRSGAWWFLNSMMIPLAIIG